MKIAIFLISLTTAAFLHAQGPLPPPSGAPTPTQKSLQQLWDELQSVKAAAATQQAQITTLLQGQQIQLYTSGSLAWISSTVGGTGYVSPPLSLAFGPDGQPAISHRDGANSDLKFTRFNGTTWTTSTVDNAGDVGYFCSLVFGPDGQPAISYFDSNNAVLKFARQGIFKPAR